MAKTAAARRRPVPVSAERSEIPPPTDWRDSIKLTDDQPLQLVWIAPEQLDDNPANWRLHPPEQMRALSEVMGDVGWAGASLYNLETGHLIDGHGRKKLQQPGVPMPVLVCRKTPEQEKKILLSLDPIASMAKADPAKLTALMESVEINAPDLEALLQGLVTDVEAIDAEAAGNVAKAEGETEEQQDGITTEVTHAVLVKCDTEADQGAVIAELEKHGLDVRALTVGFAEPEKNTEPPPQISAQGVTIRRESKVVRSPRVIQMEGMFDCPPAKKNAREWLLDWQLPDEWNIGLIVGPSGSGKSTIAKELFGDKMINGWPWPEGRSILDGFPAGLDNTTITGLLSSVGFSSPPAWVKPFSVLSNGEQFRVNLARTLAECRNLAVVDEFTSVVDRQVAQVGSCALAKAVRASNRRFVAVACHYDIVDWLQPDWIVDLAKSDKHNRVPLERRLLRRRPDVEVSIRRVGVDRWQIFRDHHYLSGSLHRSSKCFLAEVNGRPAAFTAVLHYPHFNGGWWREHRTVCLPDFQGIGLGNKVSEYVASLFVATGKAYRSTTSHPSMIRHRERSPLWRTVREQSLADGSGSGYAGKNSTTRMTAGFEYVGVARAEDAKRLGVVK